MAFEGDLSNLALGDVLQTLAMSRQPGTFVIKGPREERRLLFGPRGCGLLSARQAVRERVAEYLVGRGKVSPSDHEQAQKVARRRKDVGIDEILREAGNVADADLLDARRYVAAEDVYDLFLWPQGKFQFDSSDTSDQSPYGNVWFDVAGIAMEAARRMDEVGRLRTTCPLNEVLRRAEGSDGADLSKLGRDAAMTFEIVDGLHTVDGLLTASRIGRFDTWKALDALREGGLVRDASAHEVAAAADELRGSGDHELAVAILRRLLELAPDDDHAHQRLVDALVASGEKKAAATEWVEIGFRRTAAGDAANAAEAFRAAVKLDKDNPAAHDGLARSLFTAGEASAAADAARTACALHLDAGDVASALAVADLAVRERPDDAELRIALANAHLAAGDTANGVLMLEDAASILETTAGDERRLLDVYRRIVQLDPERKECARRIGEIESTARSRRKRLVQRAAIGVGGVLVTLLAVPLLSGPSVESRIEEARIAAAEGRTSDAAAILQALPPVDDESEAAESLVHVKSLVAKSSSKIQVAAARSRLIAATKRATDEATKAGAPERDGRTWADVFARYGPGLDALDGPDAKALGAADVNDLANIRRDFMDDVRATLQSMYAETTGHAARVTSVREKLVPELFKREDAAALADVVQQVDEIARIRTSQDWAHAAKALEDLRPRVPVKDGIDRKTIEAIQVMIDAFPVVERDGARALAALRKRQLLDRHREAHARGQELLGAGKLDEAAMTYRGFLDACDEIRRAEPRELYEPIVRDWVDGAHLEAPQRERLQQIEAIRAAEEEADAALEKGDAATAFRIRADLVRRHRAVDFRPRFRLPVRVESRPAGAEVVILDETPEGRPVGVTPLARLEYGIDENIRIAVRLEGFEEKTIERRGAIDDEGGLIAVELPKKAEFAAPGLGTVQAPAAAADGRIVVAGRDGRVRLLSDADGSEATPPFSTGSLAGCAAAPAVVGGRNLVATLDGTGFVLETATLRKVADVAFDGPVRGSLIAVPGGVAAATESGTVQLLDTEGRSLWSKRPGRVQTDPALAGHRVVVVTTDGHVVAWDAATGGNEIRVRLPEDPRWGSPLAWGDRVYVAGDGGGLACVDLAARRISWTRNLGATLRSRPAIADGRLLVTTSAGALLSIDAATGDETSRQLLGAPVRHPPVVVPDGYVVATDRGAVIRFDAAGAIVWRYDAKDDISSPPTLVDGRIVFTTRRGLLVCLRP